jgi:hypothetical protein
MRVILLLLIGPLLLAACTAGPQSASSPYCDDYARTHSRLYGVHYGIMEYLDEQDAQRAYCMRMLERQQLEGREALPTSGVPQPAGGEALPP